MTITTRRKANTFYVILIAGAAALGGFLFGFDTAVINGAVSVCKAFNTGSVLTELAVSLALLGSAVGAFYAGRIADRYGRVKAMVVASILLLSVRLVRDLLLLSGILFVGGYWVELPWARLV